MNRNKKIILTILGIAVLCTVIYLIIHFTKGSSGSAGHWTNTQINNIADILQKQMPSNISFFLPRDVILCISKVFSKRYTYDVTFKCVTKDDSSCSEFKAYSPTAVGQCAGTKGNWSSSIKQIMINVAVDKGIDKEKAICMVNSLEANYDVMQLITQDIDIPDKIYTDCDLKKKQHDKIASSESTKGICYFDIDGTLITANGDRDEMMKTCLDNNFDIGIITASSRSLEDLCDGDISKVKWMPNSLCKRFKDTGGRLFNSAVSVAGSSNLPSNYPKNTDYGFIKGFNMSFCRDSFYSEIPDKCLLLFDDDPNYLKGVKQFNPNLEIQCANTLCGGRRLDNNVVKNAIDRLVKNGCV